MSSDCISDTVKKSYFSFPYQFPVFLPSS